MLLYNQFYRQNGVYRFSQLQKPVMKKMEQFLLPKSSVLHYIPSDITEYGPPSDWPLLNGVTKVVQLHNVTEHINPTGGPRRVNININPMAKGYLMKNRRFRRGKELKDLERDDNSAVVYNYSLAPLLVKYPRSFFVKYYEWANIWGTMLSKANEVATESGRHQFITINVPDAFPSLAQLNKAVSGMTRTTLTMFGTNERLQLLQLWLWASDNRHQSLLSRIDPKNFSKINFVFVFNHRYSVVNMGLLNEWRKPTKEEFEVIKKKDATAKQHGVDSSVFGKVMLRYCMSLQENNVVSETSTIADGATNGTDNKDTGGDDADPEPEGDPAELSTVYEEEIDGVLKVLEEMPDAEIDKEAILADGDFTDDEIEGTEPDTETEIRSEHPVKDEPKTPEEAVVAVCDHMAESGGLPAADYKKFLKVAGAYKNIKMPTGQTLEQFVNISEEDKLIDKVLVMDDRDSIVDKSMLESSLVHFDTKYIKKVLDKDIAGAVLGAQFSGVAVTAYSTTEERDIGGAYTHYTVGLTPLDGVQSTIRFKLPKVNEDGTFESGGVKYFMRKQQADLPIRKVKPSKVALTSYYGKLFVERCEKRVFNYPAWLKSKVNAIETGELKDTQVTHVNPGSSFDNHVKFPRAFQILSSAFRSITVRGYVINFDRKRAVVDLNLHHVKEYEKNGWMVLASKDSLSLILDAESNWYVYNGHELTVIGSTEEALGLPSNMEPPMEYSLLGLYGKAIPLAYIFGYFYGLDKLMAVLKVKPRRVPVGTRVGLVDGEYEIVFKDQTLVFDKKDTKAAMILFGLREFHKELKKYEISYFNKPGVYVNILEANKISNRYIKELQLVRKMFVDPITRDLLIEMKEPTDFLALLFRSNELLLSEEHPDELDAAQMRTRGYERMAGAVYQEMVKSIRTHQLKVNKKTSSVEMNPYAVWRSVVQDPTVMVVNDINPIENLKQKEALTYVGSGGRTGRTMVATSRMYHKNAMGVVSESTVDSGDVGVTIFSSANPKFNSIRGTTSRYDKEKDGATSLLSTSALNSAGSTNDDPKRTNFIAIQNSHTVSCKGYIAPLVRTGYEQVIPGRVGKLYCATAQDDGVVEITDSSIKVTYKSGQSDYTALGRVFGRSAGVVIPHEIVTGLKSGQKVKKGDVLAYNSGYFAKDLLNPSKVVMKMSMPVKTVLLESPMTFEDSSSISKRITEKMKTNISNIRTISLTFDQGLRDLVKVGQHVNSDDILCTIEDEASQAGGLFNDDTMDILKGLSSNTPRAKYAGLVEYIEVFYHGEKEDMSDALRKIADSFDRNYAKHCKENGKPVVSGEVDEGFRIDGKSLALDSMVIRVYITHEANAGVGDKGVFGNQLKTVIGQVMAGEIITESGIQVDAVFGQKSVADRIVLSPDILGTGNTVLKLISKKAADIYRGKK